MDEECCLGNGPKGPYEVAAMLLLRSRGALTALGVLLAVAAVVSILIVVLVPLALVLIVLLPLLSVLNKK